MMLHTLKITQRKKVYHNILVINYIKKQKTICIFLEVLENGLSI